MRNTSIDVASSSANQDPTWTALCDYCVVVERLAVLRTLQVEGRLLSSRIHMDALKQALSDHQRDSTAAAFKLRLLQRELQSTQELATKRGKVQNLLFRTARTLRRLRESIKDVEEAQRTRVAEMDRFKGEVLQQEVQLARIEEQVVEYQQLLQHEHDLLRVLSPVLLQDAATASPVREARRLRREKQKVIAKLENASAARKSLQEAARQLRQIRKMLEWTRPRLAWVQSIRGADRPHAQSVLSVSEAFSRPASDARLPSTHELLQLADEWQAVPSQNIATSGLVSTAATASSMATQQPNSTPVGQAGQQLGGTGAVLLPRAVPSSLDAPLIDLQTPRDPLQQTEPGAQRVGPGHQLESMLHESSTVPLSQASADAEEAATAGPAAAPIAAPAAHVAPQGGRNGFMGSTVVVGGSSCVKTDPLNVPGSQPVSKRVRYISATQENTVQHDSSGPDPDPDVSDDDHAGAAAAPLRIMMNGHGPDPHVHTTLTALATDCKTDRHVDVMERNMVKEPSWTSRSSGKGSVSDRNRVSKGGGSSSSSQAASGQIAAALGRGFEASTDEGGQSGSEDAQSTANDSDDVQPQSLVPWDVARSSGSFFNRSQRGASAVQSSAASISLTGGMAQVLSNGPLANQSAHHSVRKSDGLARTTEYYSYSDEVGYSAETTTHTQATVHTDDGAVAVLPTRSLPPRPGSPAEDSTAGGAFTEDSNMDRGVLEHVGGKAGSHGGEGGQQGALHVANGHPAPPANSNSSKRVSLSGMVVSSMPVSAVDTPQQQASQKGLGSLVGGDVVEVSAADEHHTVAGQSPGNEQGSKVIALGSWLSSWWSWASVKATRTENGRTTAAGSPASGALEGDARIELPCIMDGGLQETHGLPPGFASAQGSAQGSRAGSRKGSQAGSRPATPPTGQPLTPGLQSETGSPFAAVALEQSLARAVHGGSPSRSSPGPLTGTAVATSPTWLPAQGAVLETPPDVRRSANVTFQAGTKGSNSVQSSERGSWMSQGGTPWGKGPGPGISRDPVVPSSFQGETLGLVQICVQLMTRLMSANQKTKAAAKQVQQARDLLPSRPPMPLDRCDALLSGLWQVDGGLELQDMTDAIIYAAVQQVVHMRHEVEVVGAWLESMITSLDLKREALETRQRLKQQEGQDKQRMLLMDIIQSVKAAGGPGFL